MEYFTNSPNTLHGAQVQTFWKQQHVVLLEEFRLTSCLKGVMGKSRAEIQKTYREKKKAVEGEKYLKKESERVKQYYIPASQLGPRKLQIRRERVKKSMQNMRQKLKEQGQEQEVHQEAETEPPAIDNEEDGPCDSTSRSPIPSTSSSASKKQTLEKLTVDMKFKSKKGLWKKSKALKKSESKIKQLESRVESLLRKNNTLRKKIQRSCTKKKSASKVSLEDRNLRENDALQEEPSHKRKYSELTPKSKFIYELRSEEISPTKHRKLVKKLTFHHSLVDEVKKKVEPDRGRARQRSVLQIVCGQVMKRYRFGSKSSRVLGVNRGQVSKTVVGKSIQKRRKVLERTQMAERVRIFLEREDNSAILPGKRDATKNKNGITEQTRVLNDYLYNLHLKFKSENPNVTTSLTTFSSYRPRYIRLVQFSARRTCLCQKHQNIALKVKGLKVVGAVNTDNPDILIRQNTDDEIIQKVQNCNADTIKYSQWKRKEVEHKGRMTKRMLVESVEIPKVEFVSFFRQDLLEFRKHTDRVKTQYEQVKLLKEKLPPNHAICQMDFAENYSCGHADEIQTAYFDKCSVTLHPIVIYTKDMKGTMTHASFIYVSDTPSHNSGTVYAFMKRITSELKHSKPGVECINYITDSPTSQYRNKNMIYLVANHDTLFGMRASWQYWEAGHGKGPCDGVGGTSKRLADLAVKRQTAIIQSAEDYYHWGDSLENSQTKYVFIPKEECDDAQSALLSLPTKPIKGTLEIHSVVHIKHGEIAVRNTSCFCENCFEDGNFKAVCHGWMVHSISEQNVQNTEQNELEVPDTVLDEAPTIQEVLQEESSSINQKELGEGVEQQKQNDGPVPEKSFIAAVYNDYWYIGQIVAYDPHDENLQYQISFMEHGKGKVCKTFKCPNRKDVLWMEKDQILCTVNEPIPHGTRKMYKLADTDINAVINAFEKKNKAK